MRHRCLILLGVLLGTDFCLAGIVDMGAYKKEVEAGGRALDADPPRLREAFNHFLVAHRLIEFDEAWPDVDDYAGGEYALWSLLDVAKKLDPAPAIPEEAERHMARGRAALKTAQAFVEFGDAAKEFRKASKLAPWWPDAYYNRGIVHEKQKLYEFAIRDFNFYLKASVEASDSKGVKEKLYELEYLRDRDAKAVAKGAEKGEPPLAGMAGLNGKWRAHNIDVGVGGDIFGKESSNSEKAPDGAIFWVVTDGDLILIKLLRLRSDLELYGEKDSGRLVGWVEGSEIRGLQGRSQVKAMVEFGDSRNAVSFFFERYGEYDGRFLERGVTKFSRWP